jgi:hypothetical protein
MVDEELVLHDGKVTFIEEIELIMETQERTEALASFLE